MKRLLAAFEWLGPLTCTLAAPRLPAGVVQVMVVPLATLKLVAATPPIVTPVVPLKFVPVIVKVVPPAFTPLVGEMLVTVGGVSK